TYHTCVRLSDGSLKCWGSSGYGQLGYGNTDTIGDTEVPYTVGTVSVTTVPKVTATELVVSSMNTCALLSDNSVRCWGSNDHLQLGFNSNNLSIGDNELPSSIDPLSITTLQGVTVTQLSSNFGYNCALLSTGSVKCWGLNDRGQLGLTIQQQDCCYGVHPSDLDPVQLF
ncbi:MAG TPA: hypothetical protein VNG33_06165, partial [Polyangiaceae bacterium]|nr:hypothetical protein [Polyangiaceae bacterium]